MTHFFSLRQVCQQALIDRELLGIVAFQDDRFGRFL
jgi:hypothetical protein